MSRASGVLPARCYCRGRRRRWKGKRPCDEDLVASTALTSSIWCEFWKLSASSDLWCLSAETDFSFTEGMCWRFSARRSQQAVSADQGMQRCYSSGVLNKMDKSFLSWIGSWRYAKVKRWIVYLTGLDFVLGSVCSVCIQGLCKAIVQKLITHFYGLFFFNSKNSLKSIQVPGYVFVVMVMLSVAKLWWFGILYFLYGKCGADSPMWRTCGRKSSRGRQILSSLTFGEGVPSPPPCYVCFSILFS